MNASSRRKPWPYDAIINGVGVMLKADPQSGEMVGQQIGGLDNVVPTDYDYANLPPYAERTYPFRRLYLGMGRRIQMSASEQEYHYGLNVDLSIGGLIMKGPEFTTVTPASTGSVSDFAEALDGGVVKLFALAGQYVLKRGGDLATDWTVSKDLGAGVLSQMATRWKHTGTSPVDGLFVGTSTGAFWRYNGTVWASLPVNAHYVESLRDELWVGYGSTVQKVVDDPTVAANWAATIQVGDDSRGITWLRKNTDSLFVFKSDSVFTLNQDATANDLFPLRVPPDTANGRNAQLWLESLWFSFGDSFYQMERGIYGTQNVNPVGIDRLSENLSEVRGVVAASAGHESYFLYLGLNNQQTGDSYLVKYGAWVPGDKASDISIYGQVVHGAVAKFAGKQITAMHVSSIPGPNERLYIGFSDGSISWCVLPRGSPNPLADSNCRFTMDAAELHVPIHHMMFEADTKTFRGFSVFGPTLNATNTVTIDYRVDTTQALTTIGAFSASGQRIDLVNGTFGTRIEIILRLNNTADTATPVLEGFALHEALRPAMILSYQMTPIAASYQGRHNGTTDRRTAEQIKAAVKSAAQAPGSVSVTMPDEVTADLTIVDYAEILIPWGKRNGIAWYLPIKAVEFATHTLYGTIGRLKSYTIGDLSPYTIAGLEVL